MSNKNINKKKKTKDIEIEVNNKKRIKNEKKIKRKCKMKKIIFIIILFLVIFLAIKTAISINNWKNCVLDMKENKSSQVIDKDGNIIAQIGNEKKKQTISLDEIPNNLINAYVSIEDERFYNHHGVDTKRTLSAIASYVINLGKVSFGGSTITQQIVKNLTGDDSSTISRKVSEWIKAIEIECFLTKDEILETYLNIIYVGPNIYGVETGAQYYFSKSVSELELEECAFLAGINHSPNSYNPFKEKDNSEKIKKRTITVLYKMLELNYINQEEYDEAKLKVQEGLRFKKKEITTQSIGIYSYHTDALISEIIEDLTEQKNISETFATNYLNMAGLTIYSTQNSEIQELIEKEFEKKKYILKSKNDSTQTSQAAMVIIDHKTGEVVGCVGGLGKKDTARGWNRATQSIRQTGSAGKPISVLAPALQEKVITPTSIYDDSETIFENNYAPKDYDPYRGEITVRQAVELSQNIPFVKIMEQITPKIAIKYMEKMGITTLTQKDESLPLALGGLEKGISPLEMAGAYSTIANNGIYIEPKFYTKAINVSGDIVIEKKSKVKKVLSEDVSYILKQLLTEPVLGDKGTATYCKISGIDVSAKTGTTDENYDRWLCGFTPYYTAVTWYGFDMNETINYNGKNPAGILWSTVMKDIHSNLSDVKFEMPNGIVMCTICSKTGKIGNGSCPNSYTEYFLKGTELESCTEHK